MNTSSVHSSIAPFQFLSRNVKAFNAAIEGSQACDCNSATAKTPAFAFFANPQKVVETELARAVEPVLGPDAIRTPQVNNGGFDADKLVDSLLSFINQRFGQLQNSQPDFDSAGFFSQIKQGLTTGFNDARAALENLGLLQPAVKNGLDSAYEKIQSALTKLETNAQGSVAGITQIQGVSAQVKGSADIEIVTQQGDTIKISLAQSAATRQSAVAIDQAGFTVSSLQSESENSSGFSVSIEGHLNEDEKKSLNELLKHMQAVGNEFFSGDIQSAFSHAQKIGLDTAQFSGFSLSLSLERSVKAVSAYQQGGASDLKIQPDKLKQLAEFFSKAEEQLKSAPSVLNSFENPFSAFDILFKAVNQLSADTPVEPESKTALDLFEQLSQNLASTLLSE